MNRESKKILVSTALGLAAAAALLAFGCGKGSDSAQPGDAGDNGVFRPAATLDDFLNGGDGSRAAAPGWTGNPSSFVLATSDGFDDYSGEASAASDVQDDAPGAEVSAEQPKPISNSNPKPGSSSNGANHGGSNNGGGSNPGAPATGGDANEPAESPAPASNGGSDNNDDAGESDSDGDGPAASAAADDTDLPELIFLEPEKPRDRFDLPWPTGDNAGDWPNGIPPLEIECRGSCVTTAEEEHPASEVPIIIKFINIKLF